MLAMTAFLMKIPMVILPTLVQELFRQNYNISQLNPVNYFLRKTFQQLRLGMLMVSQEKLGIRIQDQILSSQKRHGLVVRKNTRVCTPIEITQLSEGLSTLLKTLKSH